MDALDHINTLARGVAETNGLELVDTEMFRAGRRRVLRVYIGKAGGVSVEDCARVSRGMSAVLDAENWLGDERYVLEVSSPGLDRPFKTLADWKRNIGHDVRLTCREKHAGKVQHQGTLVAADENIVTLERDGERTEIPMALVALAKVDIKLS